MKETRLGEFEEVILLIVGILGEEAYTYKIADEFNKETGRSVSIGSVHSTLSRLEAKGFLTAKFGEATAKRGGRRKRIFKITAYGRSTLEASRDFKMALWNRFPSLGTQFGI